MDQQRTMPAVSQRQNGDPSAIPENAFLLLHGLKVVPLRQAIVNIGSGRDNDLVIDDPRVSRNHAQLRSNQDHYVLCDQNSSAGTYVNGVRTSRSILYPGDLISLAGFALVFGQST